MSRLRKISAEARKPKPKPVKPDLTPRKTKAKRGFNVAAYWDERYKAGRHSGSGSRGEHATRKIQIISTFIRNHGIRRVYDLGCGDMFVMKKVHHTFPDLEYTGVDISPEIIQKNQKSCPWGNFQVVQPGEDIVGSYDLILCYDVLFHLPKPAFDRTLEILRDADAPWVILSAWRKPMPNMAQHVFFNEFEPAKVGIVSGRENLDDYRTSFTIKKERKHDSDSAQRQRTSNLPSGTTGQGTSGGQDLSPPEREGSAFWSE